MSNHEFSGATEVYLAPEEIIKNAKEIAEESKKAEKYIFCIIYEAAGKLVVLSEIKRLECEILEQSDIKSSVTVRISMSQLAAIKTLNYIEKVEVVEYKEVVSDTEISILKNTDENGIINTETVDVADKLPILTETSEAVIANSRMMPMCYGDDCYGDDYYGDDTGNGYDNSNTMQTAIYLPLATWTSGNISCPGTEIWYRFTANISNATEYTIQTSGSLDTVGYLYNSNGSLITSNDDCGSYNFSITGQLTYGATYYVKVKAYGSNVGDYSIQVSYTTASSGGDNTDDNYSNDMSTAIPLSLNSWQSGEIYCPCMEMWYKFTANVSDATQYIIQTSGSLDTVGYLYNSNGSLITCNDDCGSYNFGITGPLTYGATYYVKVKAYGSNVGDYSIRVSYTTESSGGGNTNNNYSNDMSTAIPLSLNSWQSGEICCPCVEMWYKFTANVSDATQYIIQTSGSLDTMGYLYNSNGSLIISNDDACGSHNFRISAQLTHGATYYVKVKAYGDNVGYYSIQVSYTTASQGGGNTNNNYSNDMSTAIPLGLNSWQSGEICCPDAEIWYKFTPSTTSSYTIYTSGSLDTVGYLYDSNNNQLHSNDDGCSNRNFKIEHYLFANNTYYIKARAYGNNIGTFSITVINTVFTDCTIPVQGIMMCCSTYVMNVGEVTYLSYDIYPADATNPSVTWCSSVPNVAVVNASTGRITARSAGTTIVTATTNDGSFVASCMITVNEEVLVNSIDIHETCAIVYAGDTVDLNATVYPLNATNKRIRWSSSDATVATVDETTGLVIAKAAGEVIICASAQDGSGVKDYYCLLVKQSNLCPVPEQAKGEVEENFFADPIDVYTGAHVLKNTIMSLYGGQGLKLTVRYDSTKLSNGLFGAGWYHNYEKCLEIYGCEARVYNSPSVYSKYQSYADCTVFTCTTANKSGYVLHVDYSKQYPYTINCNSERTEHYDSTGRLAKIVDHQGFETQITYSDRLITITDAVSGKKMYLEKDANGRIARVYDEASRQATFTYRENMLIGICDVNGNTLTYTYNEDGQVISGTDSMNICYFENTYDEYGRVIIQKDAISGSTASTFEYGCCGERITTDRNGNQSTRIFNDNGLLTSYTDENGNTKTYTYDSRCNVLKETDANGNSVTKSYNSLNKPTVITDKNGNKTFLTYDDAGNVTKIQYPEVNGVVPEERFVYNSNNQLTQHTDVRGTVTVYTYDASAMPESKKVGSKNAMLYSYENGLLKSQTDALGHTTTYGYNTIGQMTSKTNAKNQVTCYEYDACGNLIKTTDANGKTVVNTYDGNHQKTSVIDANGNQTGYTYNGNMKNTLVTLPDGNTIRYEFDGEDRPIKVTDQAGNATITQYDKAGRVVSKQYPDGGIVQYEYDPVGNMVKETNQKGAVVTKTYDAMGNVLSVTDADGNITRYQYNALSKVTRAVNAVSGATMYEYSPSGDLLSETNPLGHKKTYTYDAYGNRLTETDAMGNTTVYTYDANNNLLTVRNALGNTTTYAYNSLNQLVSVTDAKDNVIKYGYDALGRRTTITDARNNMFTTVYDANGNVIQMLDAKGNMVSETTYNSLNQPASVTDAAGQTSVYTYNVLGKVASITDAMNHRQEYSYNSRGQNTQVKDALNNVSMATFDNLGNMTRLAGPLGGNTEYTYDSLGRLIAETTTSEGEITYGYNELNLKEHLTNARGQVRKYFYDAAGRITGYVGVEDSVSYTYDANGNILTVTDKNGIITRTYDALNRVSSYTDTFGKTIRYVYDAVGNLERMTYPDNTTVTYEYDANNNLTKVTDWSGRMTNYTYDVNNKVVGVTNPDGSITTTVYDNAQRITSTVEKTAGGAIITGFTYTYDTLGRIIEEGNLAYNTKLCYTYDNLSRVTERAFISPSNYCVEVENFSYDAAGNETSGVCIYDINNRLTSYNGDAVTYDADGNMLSAPLNYDTTTFEYDSANRLLKAGSNAYTYNAEDVRIRNLCDGYETCYTYNTQCRLSQLLMKTTNGVVTKYVYGLGLIGEEKQGAFKTYHFDYRGSTVAITNESGYITDTFLYDTYGKVISRTGSSFIIFGYNGRDGVITDSNGLIYMRARCYSPELRRFANADIIKGEITNAITLNRYAYANGNPVSNVDPFGLAVDEKGSNYVNDISKIWKSITDWFAKNFGFATTLESKYDTISVDGIFWGHEEGVTLSKVYSGNYKPIEFIQEISRDISLGLDSQFGIKVNFNDESGFKMSYGKNETSFEVAIGDFYLEMLVGLDKIGFTTSAEADWKEYEIGAYDHWYIRPNTLALAAVAVYFAYPVVVPAASTLIPILEKVGK